MASTQSIRTRKPPTPRPAPAAGEHEPARKPANGSEKPGTMIELPADEDFWIFLSQFSPDQWQFLIGYLWRCKPITDRSTGGKPTNVCKYTRPFDVDTIMQEHGSGVYRIDFCQIAPNGNQQKRIRQHYFTIMNMSYPPKVPLGEWIEAPENEMWKWAEPLLRAQQQEPAPAAAPGGVTDPNQLFNTVLHGMQVLRGDQSDNASLAAQVLQMVQSSQAQVAELTDPTKQLTTLRELLHLIKPDKGGGDSDTKLIVDLLREDLRETKAELARIRESSSHRKTVLEEIKDAMPLVVEFANMLGFKRGAAATGSSSEWATVVSGAVDKIGDHIPLIAEAIRTRNAPQQPANIWPSLPQPNQPQPQPAAATPPPASQETAAMTDEQKKEQQVKAVLARYGALIQLMAPILVDHYRSHYSGYDFRNWFLDRHGLLNWTGLKDEAGAALLTEIAQSHPMLKVALAPPERLLAFLTEFFTERGQEPEGAEIITDQGNAPAPGSEEAATDAA